ncbi:MAG: FHA domain-containing protein [Bacteriovoracaceae bacterium]|jgi:pSer/pThr/pTyr-binding forkhead associated (FHA) protein
MAKNVLVMKHLETPKEAGNYFRLMCLTGPNKGESYVLIGNRIVVGRGEKADIRLNDTKSSREHAEITKVGDNYVVTDLGSQNGILVNDQKSKQSTFKEGDKLIIGQTVLKFSRFEVTSKTKVIKEKSFEDDAPEQKRSLKPILILLLVLLGFYFFETDQNPETQQKKKQMTSVDDVSNEYFQALQKRQANQDKEVKEKLNVIYQRGLREYREKNYFRAINEFNLALILSPNDSQAEFYLRKTKEELDRTIEDYVVKANRDEDSLKYKGAIISYCAIIRLLYAVPDDPRHKNAEKQIKELETKLGMEEGESNCLKKQSADQ